MSSLLKAFFCLFGRHDWKVRRVSKSLYPDDGDVLLLQSCTACWWFKARIFYMRFDNEKD